MPLRGRHGLLFRACARATFGGAGRGWTGDESGGRIRSSSPPLHAMSNCTHARPCWLQLPLLHRLSCLAAFSSLGLRPRSTTSRAKPLAAKLEPYSIFSLVLTILVGIVTAPVDLLAYPVRPATCLALAPHARMRLALARHTGSGSPSARSRHQRTDRLAASHQCSLVCRALGALWQQISMCNASQHDVETEMLIDTACLFFIFSLVGTILVGIVAALQARLGPLLSQCSRAPAAARSPSSPASTERAARGCERGELLAVRWRAHARDG